MWDGPMCAWQKNPPNPIQHSFLAPFYRHSREGENSQNPKTGKAKKTKIKQFQSLTQTPKLPHLFLFKNEPIPRCGKNRKVKSKPQPSLSGQRGIDFVFTMEKNKKEYIPL
jgi:hypothetical protein